MIEIIYTGQKGFYNITTKNHNRLIKQIKAIDEVNVNWFTKPNNMRGICPFDNTEGRGAIQVWDLMDALTKVPNDIFIRMRTDLWFTPEAIDIIIKELQEVVSGNQDISFVGWMYKDWDFNQPFNKISTNGQSHIQDFVIIGNKSKLETFDNILSKLNGRPMSKSQSGNKTFGDIIKDRDKAFTVKTHMYICRKEYDKINEQQLAIDYFDAYAKGKANNYKEWYIKNKI